MSDLIRVSESGHRDVDAGAGAIVRRGGRPPRRGEFADRGAGQTVRRTLILTSALLFPVTMIYFSPGMVFRGARLGVVSGSYITFAVLFASAIVFGRAWCGWLCPAAGLAELVGSAAGDAPFRANRAKTVKYAVWIVWLMALALVAIVGGGEFRSVDPFLGTDHGISIHSVGLMLVYYVVVGVVVIPSWLFGRRGFCHVLCWMAPFMVLGSKLGRVLRVPVLRLTGAPERCSGCGRCEDVCPMSLPVKAMQANRVFDHVDCIVCGACVDACPGQALRLVITTPGREEPA